jgi:AhpC/TSA family
MANALTGDFDVVAEFAIPAANRVIAAMHRSERLLHSVTMRVDDNAPAGSNVIGPSVVGSVDTFGDPVVNHQQIGHPNPYPGASAATNAITAALDPVVNINEGEAVIVPVEPSHFQGRAQLQVFPPTLEVTDAFGSRVTMRMQMMSRYLPDPQTPPAAEFIRGELQITAAVGQVASQVPNVNVVDIDFNPDNAIINFVPSWSSRSLSGQDIAGINLLIRNALKTSFLPSNATLPANVKHIQFKTLVGTPSALCVLLNMGPTSGAPGSMNSHFIGPADDFAFAVGVDYLRAVLQPTIDNILGQTYNFTVPIDVWLTTYHVSYSIALSSVTVNPQNGKIVLNVQGKATQTSDKWYAPDNFTFTAQLSFTLVVDGDTADLVPGDVSLDTSSWVVNLFRGSATDGMKQVRDQALTQSGAYDTVRQMFSAGGNLGGLLRSLLAPTRRRFPIRLQSFHLAYTSVEIRPTGIVLHGALTVNAWPQVHVEYEQIPSTVTGPVAQVQGPAYSALKSWIPGGLIQQYEWSLLGQSQPFLIEPHKFIYQQGPPVVAELAAYIPPPWVFNLLCLTVRGTRLTSSGPVVSQAVVAKSCGILFFPIISPVVAASLKGSFPSVALTYADAQGQVQVVGHASARPGVGGGTPNLLVHFADGQTSSRLDFLTQALAESKREDAVTAVLAVLTPDQLSKARHTEGVIYAEDQDGAWEKLLGVKGTGRPVTLIVGSRGNVVWQKEGGVDVATLTAALQKFLVRTPPVTRGMLRVNLRLGQPAPNFLFQYAPGRELTLRKLSGTPCTLIFWKSTSKASIQAVRDLRNGANETISKASGQEQVILAINDGESGELARAVAAENGFADAVVIDPERAIAVAYGVSFWPTIVFTDDAGVVTGIRYGHGAKGTVGLSTEQTTVTRAE